MHTLNIEEAKQLVTKAGPNIDSNYDMTRGPWMLEPRTDLVVFQRTIDSIFSAESAGRGISFWQAMAIDSFVFLVLVRMALPEALSNFVNVSGYSKENPQKVLV